MKNFMRTLAPLFCVFASLVLIFLASWLVSPTSNGPPGWDEKNIVFDSDEDMLAYDDFLIFNTDGLTVSSAHRWLSFDCPQDKDLKSWSRLDVLYRMDDASALSMHVYPNELTTTDGFPYRDLELKEMDFDGISVQYQEFKDNRPKGCEYSFCALFVYKGCTYELTVSSPTNPDILTDYLSRII